MATAVDLLGRAQAAGIRLRLDAEGGLSVSCPPSADHLLSELREHRDAVREAVAERQAIQSVERQEEHAYLSRVATWSDSDLTRAVRIARRAGSEGDYTRALEAETVRRMVALTHPAPYRAAPGPWPSATVEVRVGPDGTLTSGPLRGPDGAEIEADGRRREP